MGRMARGNSDNEDSRPPRRPKRTIDNQPKFPVVEQPEYNCLSIVAEMRKLIRLKKSSNNTVYVDESWTKFAAF